MTRHLSWPRLLISSPEQSTNSTKGRSPLSTKSLSFSEHFLGPETLWLLLIWPDFRLKRVQDLGSISALFPTKVQYSQPGVLLQLFWHFFLFFCLLFAPLGMLVKWVPTYSRRLTKQNVPLPFRFETNFGGLGVFVGVDVVPNAWDTEN